MSGSCTSINRVFSRKVIEDLIEQGSNPVFNYVVSNYINNPQSKTYGEIINEIYNYLGNSNRNEYYYMNTLLNKLLVGIHNVNTTTALSQVRIGSHIADFVMINGEGQVYEIKSDLDNLERLSDQLLDYFKAFNKVSVLASEHERNHVEHILSNLGDMGDAVGIYVLTEKDTIFSQVKGRKPQQYDEFLNHRHIFNLLRKKEYENVLISYFGELPETAPVFYYKKCLAMFENIPILEAQSMAMQELKKRKKIAKSEFQEIPTELKSVVYFTNLSKKIAEIENLYRSNFGGYWNVFFIFKR